jgi:hypothetical protein
MEHYARLAKDQQMIDAATDQAARVNQGRELLAGLARSGRAAVLVSDMDSQGAMVLVMILTRANALSISRCTRSTSDFRNVCSCWTSDMSPSSPATEVDVNRTMEDLIRSASDGSGLAIVHGRSTWVDGFRIFSSTNLLISESNFSADVEDDVGVFIEIFRNVIWLFWSLTRTLFLIWLRII